MANKRREDAPVLLPFRPADHSVESTDEFEIDVPPCSFAQTLDVRFFPKARAREAIASRNETRIILPTGGIMLVTIRPASPSLSARSLPV